VYRLVGRSSSADSVCAGVDVIRGAGRRSLALGAVDAGEGGGAETFGFDRLKVIHPITTKPAANNAMIFPFIFCVNKTSLWATRFEVLWWVIPWLTPAPLAGMGAN
jgi:hypothetical protein